MKAKICPNEVLDGFITPQTAEGVEGTDLYDILQPACVSPWRLHDLSDNPTFVYTPSATTEHAVSTEATSLADHSPSATLVRKRRGTGGEVKPIKRGKRRR